MKQDKNWGKQWLPEALSAFAVLFFRFVYYKNAVIAELADDSASYINLNWEGFQRGERMPLYPLLIRFHRLLWKNHYLEGVVCCQILVSLIAVVFLYKAVKLAVRNLLIACIAAVFWGCYPGVMGYDTVILSESLALSLSVFLLYFTVRYIRHSTGKNGGRMLFAAFLAVCQKSALFIYVPATFVLLAMQFFLQKEKRKTVCRLAGINLLIAALLFLHACQVNAHASTFGIDKRGPRHMLAACLESGLYKNYPDQKLVREIETIYTENDQKINWTVFEPIMQMFGGNSKEYNPGLRKFCLSCIRSDPGGYLRYLFSRFTDNIRVTFEIKHAKSDRGNAAEQFVLQMQNQIFFPVSIGQVYLIYFALLFLLIKKWLKSGQCPWYYLGAVGILSAIIISVFVGTYNVYERCMIYILPFTCFGMALLFRDLAGAVQKYGETPANDEEVYRE